ncbi:hypothetical protein ACLOJK_040092 [Asimina triloba]
MRWTGRRADLSHLLEIRVLVLPEELESDDVRTAVVYKSGKRKQLEGEGYRILGNMGDQWSDILGTNAGQRTFKVPDPMYYIS